MNYLLSYGAAGMGDFIATMMFLRDFEEQMPDDSRHLFNCQHGFIISYFYKDHKYIAEFFQFVLVLKRHRIL